MQNIFCIDHDWWRRRAAASADIAARRSNHKIENLLLLDEAEIFQNRVGISLNIGKDHLARIANEKAVRKIDNPLPIDLGQQMMRHLFLKEDALAGPDRSGQLLNNFPPISFAVRDDFIRTGMILAGPL